MAEMSAAMATAMAAATNGDGKRERDEMASAATSVTDGGGLGKRGRTDGGEQQQDSLYFKMLIEHKSTGSVIGKQGLALKQIMEKSGARVRISATDEVLPGTSERICTISAVRSAETSDMVATVSEAAQLVSAAVYDARQAKDPTADVMERVLKLLVPNAGVGVVIGKGGATIKEISASSGAVIRISQPSEIIMATQERVVTVKGTQAQIDIAQKSILEMLSVAPPAQQPQPCDYRSLKSGGPVGGMGGGQPQFQQQQQQQQYAPQFQQQQQYAAPQQQARVQQSHSPRQNRPAQAPIDPVCLQNFITYQPVLDAEGSSSLAIPLPDRLISGIIGKGGSQIKDITSRSSAVVKISQKDQVTAGGERTVTVSGNADAVATAKSLIEGICREMVMATAQGAEATHGGGGGAGQAGGGYGLVQQIMQQQPPPQPAYAYGQPAAAPAPVLQTHWSQPPGGAPQGGAPQGQAPYNPAAAAAPPVLQTYFNQQPPGY